MTPQVSVVEAVVAYMLANPEDPAVVAFRAALDALAEAINTDG